MLALPISMPRFKNIVFFNQNRPKIKLFLQKKQNFRALGAPPLDARASGGRGLRPQTPNGLRRLEAPPQTPEITPTPLQIPGYAPEYNPGYVSLWHAEARNFIY